MPDKSKKAEETAAPQSDAERESEAADKVESETPKEIGGTKGPEPTRYGDWEHKGIISDF